MSVEPITECPCCLGPKPSNMPPACQRCCDLYGAERQAAIGMIYSEPQRIAWYRAKGEQLRAEGKMPALAPKAPNAANCSTCGADATGCAVSALYGRPLCQNTACWPRRVQPKATETPRHEPALTADDLARDTVSMLEWLKRADAERSDNRWVVSRGIRDAAHLARLLFATDAALLAALARVEGPGAPSRDALIERAWERDESGRRTACERMAAAVYAEVSK